MLHRLPTLFMFGRNAVPEVAVQGMVALREAGGGTFSNAATSMQFVTRSLLKPWQYIASDIGSRESFWAVGFASHSAQPAHLDALKALSEKAGAGEADLICPRSWPLDPLTSTAMRMRGDTQTRMFNPCSGKHLMMLAACRQHDYPLSNYFSPDHPLQKRVYNLVGREASERLEWFTDSCGLPVAAMSVDGYLGLWEKLARSSDPRVIDLKELWLANPRLVGGVKRLDSDLMEAFPNRLLAKEGADGLLALQTLPGSSGGSAGVSGKGNEPSVTCFVKVSAGYNPAHLGLALTSLLHQKARTGPLTQTLSDLMDYLQSRQEEWVPRDQNLMLPPFT